MHKNFVPSKIYRKVASLVPISGVDLAIKQGSSFLLVKRKENPAKNQWWFAGGRISFGEKMIETAKRKLREELNIKSFRKLKFLGIAEVMFRKNCFGKPEHDMINVFLVELSKKDSSKIKPDKTMYGYKWFKKVEKKFHPHVRKYLRLVGFK